MEGGDDCGGFGAGDGKYTFAAVERVGVSGKVYATEIDAKKLEELRSEVAKRKLGNVIVAESKEAETNLPAALLRCDFFEARVPSPDEAGGVRRQPGAVLKSGGGWRLSISRRGRGWNRWKEVPSNRADTASRRRLRSRS